MDLVIMEWLVRYRYWVALVLVVLALLVYLGKAKTGWQGWRKFVFGNFGSIIGGTVRGVSIAIGFVLKKVPWKPILIWGPWVLVVLVLAFYGVENWRGARAWEKVRSDWEARGEKLSVAEFMPEPIPDEENFAKHQVVVAEMGSGARLDGPRGGGMSGFSSDRRVWHSTPDLGKPVDVTLWLPVADRLTGERESAQRCLELMAPQAERMAGIAEAARRPRCDFGLHGDHGPVAERWMNPMVFRLLGWTNAFSSRAGLHVRVGNPEEALRDIATAMRLAEQCGEDPLLIGALIEMAIVRSVTVTVWEGLRAHAWTEDQLGALEERMETIDCRKRGMAALRCDAAYSAEMTGLLKDHREELRNLTDVLGWMTGSHSPGWWDNGVQKAEEWVVYLIPDGWFDQMRAASLTNLDQAVLRPGGVRATALEFGMMAAIEGEGTEAPGVLSQIWGFGYMQYGSMIGRFLTTQAEVDQARVAIGLERYRLRTGGYPERLEELVPRELEELPTDLVTGEALRYRVKEDGTPLIWSMGLDGDDDGGVPARQPEDLDWVWQYTGTPGQTEGDWRVGRKPRKK